MRVIDCTQGSPEWHDARRGKVTASRIADVMAKTKTGYSTSRANYAAELVAERLTGTTPERYTNDAMKWGSEKEPEARDLYAFMTNAAVTLIGCVIHPSIELSMASPDGLVGDAGLVEIKCPNTATHIDTLLGDEIDGRYLKQMQWQLACTGRYWCDFVSYDPRMPAEMQVHIRRVQRNDDDIAVIESEVIKFLSEVDGTVAKLTALYRAEAA